ncbi:MAG: dethiobiotin synthase [Deltaproteobacteria bacterium]
MKGIFVTGTDTGVGKTVASAALAWTLKCAGRRVAPMKPAQTGIASGDALDIEFIQRVLGADYPLNLVCPYRFAHPLAPSVAAALEGAQIDLEIIKSAYHSLASAYDTVVVEGAGGLLAPLWGDYLMADLASDLNLPLVIVSRPGLGALNHLKLTVESAEARGIAVLGTIINRFPAAPSCAEITNPRLMQRMTGRPILGALPEDGAISVERGNIGNLRDAAPVSLVSLLGGSFDVNEFLSELDLRLSALTSR